MRRLSTEDSPGNSLTCADDRGPGSHSAGERGSATVVGIGAVLALLALTAAAVQFGAAVITRHRAEAAADLAALAAAAYLVNGDATACDQARRVAGRMTVRMVACEPSGWEVSVEIEAAPPGFLDRFGVARAMARAGPAPAEADPSQWATTNGRRPAMNDSAAIRP